MIEIIKRTLRVRAARADLEANAGPPPARVDATFVGRGPRRHRRRLAAALAADPDAAFACGPVLAPPTSRKAPFTVVAAGWELGHDGSVVVPIPIGAGEEVDPAWAAAVTEAAAPTGDLVAVRRGATRPSGVVVWAAPTVDGATPPPPVDDVDVDRRRRQGFGSEVTVEPGPPTAPAPAARWVGSILRRAQAGIDGDGPPPTVAIRHAATDWSVAEGWGDHHFAGALAKAFGRRGVGARVVPHHAWEHPFAARDLVVTLRGLRPVVPVSDRFNVLWVISHPDEVTTAELDAHDLVAVASVPDAGRISRLTSTPVFPLLQATDPDRFRRTPRVDAEGVVFVGNSRGVERRAVSLAAAAGIPVTVHGAGWEGLAPAGVDLRDPVPNPQVPDVFNASAVVLADHWDDMARLGYVANRLFDVYAAGGLVVSDRVAGLEDVLPGTPTFDGDIRGVVDRWADPGNRDRRLELIRRLQEEVLSKHTFDARVDELATAIGAAGGADLLETVGLA